MDRSGSRWRPPTLDSDRPLDSNSNRVGRPNVGGHRGGALKWASDRGGASPMADADLSSGGRWQLH